MTDCTRLAAFERFIQSALAVCATSPGYRSAHEKTKIRLEDLVREPAMIEHCKTWPSTEGHKNLLLYEDSDYDFVVYAVVRTPAAPAGFTITPMHGPFMDLSTASRDWNDPGASTPVKGRTMRLFDSKASAKASPAKWIWFSRSQSTRKKAVRTGRWP